MQVLGQVLVLVPFGLTAIVSALALAGAIGRRRRLVRASGYGMGSVAWLNAAIALVLLHGFLTHDFSNQYIASYSDTGMPLVYLLSAFWAGEKGALLFWVVSLSSLAALLCWRHRGDETAFFGATNAVVALALLFFDVLMVFASHPFEVFLTHAGPGDGSGMNPLLQNPLMAIHPPLQLMGFVAYTIPFGFAVGALVSGRLDGSWLEVSRPWNLFAWTVLTAGLIIGGLWAYLELGWGGFWGWDPVENAALFPWLSGTALLHSSAAERRRGMLRRWNFVLVMLTFILTIFATFLTRSQLIASLHSFANSVLTPYFLYYMLALVLICFALLAWRYRKLEPANRVESLWSRESLVVANSLLFMVAIFIVLWGTLLPKLSESPALQASINSVIDGYNSLTGSQVARLTRALDVGPDWFNRVVSPVGLLILMLTAIGPILPFRTGNRPMVLRSLGWTALGSAGIALVVGLAVVLTRADRVSTDLGFPFYDSVIITLRGLSVAGIYGLLGVLFAVWVLATASVDTLRAVRASRRITGRRFLPTAVSLLRNNPGRFGGHVVHAGLALCFLGFAGAAAKEEKKDVVLEPMGKIQLGGTDLTLVRTRGEFVVSGGYASVTSEVLAYPHRKPLPGPVLDGLRSVPEVLKVESPSPPEALVEFQSPGAARAFHARNFARTVILEDFKVARVDRGRRQLYLAPASLESLKVIPGGFRRLMEKLKTLETALGKERLTVLPSRGDPLLVLRCDDAELFESLLAGLVSAQPPAYLVTAMSVKDPSRVRILPAGVGRILKPEMRFYLKFENPTTEVDIESGLLYDLYVASMPGRGSLAVNLSATSNPLMTWLWAGSLVVILMGFVLVVPRRSRRRPRDREVSP